MAPDGRDGTADLRDGADLPDACGAARSWQSQMQQPSDPNQSEQNTLHLNPSQQYAVDTICKNWEKQAGRYLLFGVTGERENSRLYGADRTCVVEGEQAILLIPEISLTYQNVIRFYHRFGDRISILHSRLSQAERYDQFERARKRREVDVMIGPTVCVIYTVSEAWHYHY